MCLLLDSNLPEGLSELVILALNHEQQHQELLATDIKYILGNNPLMPDFEAPKTAQHNIAGEDWVTINSGLYNIGFTGNGFCFDNELGQHTVYLPAYHIASTLVINEEYLAFMHDGGYTKHQYWHAEGWDWVKNNNISAPMYWHLLNNAWHYYEPSGLQPVNPGAPLRHISFYEAAAYAAWKGMRLPTEFE